MIYLINTCAYRVPRVNPRRWQWSRDTFFLYFFFFFFLCLFSLWLAYYFCCWGHVRRWFGLAGLSVIANGANILLSIRFMAALKYKKMIVQSSQPALVQQRVCFQHYIYVFFFSLSSLRLGTLQMIALKDTIFDLIDIIDRSIVR